MESQNNKEWNSESLVKERESFFDNLIQSALMSENKFIDFKGPYGKEVFLEYLANKKGLIFHGSNSEIVGELEPRQANCQDKKFGNLKAVYATKDYILPMFYAIKDKEKFRGIAKSGYTTVDVEGKSIKNYDFRVELQTNEKNPWSDGIIYIFNENEFKQGTDDENIPIDEYISEKPISPILKLRVSPKEFPYFYNIKRSLNDV